MKSYLSYVRGNGDIVKTINNFKDNSKESEFLDINISLMDRTTFDSLKNIINEGQFINGYENTDIVFCLYFTEEYKMILMKPLNNEATDGSKTWSLLDAMKVVSPYDYMDYFIFKNEEEFDYKDWNEYEN